MTNFTIQRASRFYQKPVKSRETIRTIKEKNKRGFLLRYLYEQNKEIARIGEINLDSATTIGKTERRRGREVRIGSSKILIRVFEEPRAHLSCERERERECAAKDTSEASAEEMQKVLLADRSRVERADVSRFNLLILDRGFRNCPRTLKLDTCGVAHFF